MNSRIITAAGRLFEQARYLDAIDLYEEAKQRYGLNSLDGMIKLCRYRLGQTRKQAIPLDRITRYLLNGQSQYSNDPTPSENLLKEIEETLSTRSKPAPTRDVKPTPGEWPSDLILTPLPDSTNDFEWMLRRSQFTSRQANRNSALSVIVPTYNRCNILEITLSCLANQQTDWPFEVIVADDGSSEDIQSVVRKFESRLDVKHIRHADTGYKLCAVRNFGIRSAQYDWIAILDCDMAPNPRWVQGYCELLERSDQWALIGPRKYVDTNGMLPDTFLSDPDLIIKLPEVKTNNSVAAGDNAPVSKDWRLEHFTKTESLRLCNTPFRYFSGGNVAFSKHWVDRSGWFDEDFTAWGGEDNEFAFRLYRAGCYFRYVEKALAYHQEPPGKENETNREMGHKITRDMVVDRVPYVYRKLVPLRNAALHKVPLVSIYIPAFNAVSTIERAIESALMQTVSDLEVCVCDDGSTDQTPELLKNLYSNHPRVRYVRQENGGIGRASNTALGLTRGYYIGQLDSDDFLNPDAVELCLKEFLRDHNLACVYTANENLYLHEDRRSTGYNWPIYSREKLTCAMICHHFRMFTARAWHLTSGFAEDLKNAVDYDMYLKLSEVGAFKHINMITYTRVLHGANTSTKSSEAQKINHFIAANRSFERQGLNKYRLAPADEHDVANRTVRFVSHGS